MFTLQMFELVATDGLATWYGGAGQPVMPKLDPGPYGDPNVLDYPNSQIVFSPAPGPGMSFELAFDRPMFSVYAIGDQGDYQSAEDLAGRLDLVLQRTDRPQDIAGLRTLSIVRAGGAPSLIACDESSRYHFMCAYIAQVDSGL